MRFARLRHKKDVPPARFYGCICDSVKQDVGFIKPSPNIPKSTYSCYNNMLIPLHMLLLIAGATDITRELLAATFLEEHPDWKHLALEDIYSDDGESEAIDEFQMSFSTIVACECVRDARKEAKCPVLITCPTAMMLETVQEEFPKELVCIRIGSEKEWDGQSFHHEVNTKMCSLKQIGSFLRKLADA